MKLKQISLAVLAATTMMAGMATSQAAEVEVLHYWTSGGEAKSAAELKKMMEAKGITWKDFAVAGGGGENATTALKARVIAGSAPTAAQIKGPSIQEWGNEGVLANIDAAATEGKWDSLLPKVVSNVMKYKGHYVAAPINVHRVNWLWINPEVLKKAGATTPTNFDEFFVAADKIKKAGFIAVAHGGQPWQDATVFESVALGVGGAEFYKKALIQLDPATLSGPTMIKTFDTLGKIKTYIDKDSAGRDWNLATAMVINGKAGMQFMGDWAKGEFTAAGKQPGKDYLCVAAPGTEKSYTFNIDSLAMFNVKGAEQQKAQLTLATAVMSPEFQEIFNLNKGSIPVRAGVSRAKFDSCALKSMDDMDATNKSGGLVPSFAHGMAIDSAKAGAIQDVIAKFMNSNMTSQAAAQALVKAAKAK
ncbi:MULTISPECIES: ABC transporter substrate-binding protein [unclassified Undibacterium]|uniref:ABC transporter substrate-binding protein n=1 Tax=unclassified Undibacterium TaxID=2630295 RepID=UPI002AC8B76A|nr:MULTISPECIES: ABC transporter substrate-binding protein [unclassified Undibacterium]MEB0140874.1 ABC transporter substrate-binding protein [Undibacterium sp. CCC2.1]MEB0173842.1 ABC transporter substrate-binding protein [Undibacterium sp. CCC1.1]MEB0177843.1 ABC transporter substrate-binding protein [Undibacterium sp. CCC3.4]MEB0217048.1 ABC transporter substrate-binding protein [Undibacterium sp. 5I2]WPX44641.1 ABC transporter substrate-binding protein [Undibacterium sp. CCC3.4]